MGRGQGPEILKYLAVMSEAPGAHSCHTLAPLFQDSENVLFNKKSKRLSKYDVSMLVKPCVRVILVSLLPHPYNLLILVLIGFKLFLMFYVSFPDKGMFANLDSDYG